MGIKSCFLDIKMTQMVETNGRPHIACELWWRNDLCCSEHWTLTVSKFIFLRYKSLLTKTTKQVCDVYLYDTNVSYWVFVRVADFCWASLNMKM